MQVTVGICAYNEGKNIAQLLDNILFEQKLSTYSEILVVCSGCTDNTVEIAKGYAALDSRINVVTEKERQGKASAINCILSKAAGDVILFVSADTLPQEGCFSRLLSGFSETEVGLVCGNPEPINSSRELIGKLVQTLWHFHNHVFTQLNDLGLVRHATEIFCVRKGIVDKIPTDTVNDDAYIALITKKKGWLIKYERASRVSICGPKTFPEYLQQRRRIIYGHYQLKKQTGESPQHLMHLMPAHPITALRLGLWLTKEQEIPTILAFLLSEFTANIEAIIDIVSKRKHCKWSTLPSTKTLTPMGTEVRLGVIGSETVAIEK